MLAIRAFVMFALIALLGCRPGQGARVTSTLHRLSGLVLTSAGRPVVDGIVIVTDPATTDEIALTRTDADGRFEVKSPVMRVAVTAASPNGWAFLPTVDIGGLEVRVHLNGDCHAVRGRVALDDPPPLPRVDVLRIGRLGDDIGDMFGASLDSEYRFVACLPRAEYYITLPSEFIERTILTMIPRESPVVVRSATRRSVETTPTTPLDVSAQTQVEFVADLPISVQVLGLGETNHGTHEFTKERTQLAIALARQHRFTLLLLEAGYGEVLALDDYIQGKNVAIDEAVAALGYWVWNTTTLRDSLKELREHNRVAPANGRITLRGVDMQSTAGAVDELLASKIAFSPDEAKLLLRLREKDGAQWVDLSPGTQVMIRGTLVRIAADRDSAGLDSIRNRHALSARSLLLRFDHLEQHGFWNRSRVRDKGMADLAQEILALAPDARATVWAHLIHVAREFVIGAPTMGHHLAAALGSGYRVYGLLSFGGSALARHARKELGVVPHALPIPPPYSLERVLLQGMPRTPADVTYWTFGSARQASRQWLDGLRWVQLFGVVYPANNLPFQILDLKTFDGAILFRSITPSQPMPAGNKPTGS